MRSTFCVAALLLALALGCGKSHLPLERDVAPADAGQPAAPGSGSAGTDTTTGSGETPGSDVDPPGTAEGFPLDANLGELTDGESIALCEWIVREDVQSGNAEAWCVFDAVLVESTRPGCEEAVATCRAAPPVPPTEDCAAFVSDFPFPDCPVTVRQYVACLNDQSAYFVDLVDDVSCDDPGNPQVLPELHPTCVALESECPALFDPSAAEFVCSDGTGIPGEWVCDTIEDCPRGEDEAGCPSSP